MKVLLDEMLPIGVRELLPSHEVYSAAYAGFAGISNGEMIRRAIGAGFDVIVTLDRGIPRQQNLERSGIGFVLIPHNDLDRIRPYADELHRRPGVEIRRLLRDAPFAKDVLVASTSDLPNAARSTAIAEAIHEGVVVYER